MIEPRRTLVCDAIGTNVPPISDVRGAETTDHGEYDQRGVTG